MNTFNVLGVKVSVTNLDLAWQQIASWVESRTKTYVCVLPLSPIVENSQQDPQYRKIVNEAGMATPDGMPLVWLGKWRGYQDIERTYGPDLLLKVCEEGQKKGLRHYFYGTTPQTNQLLADNLKKRFTDLNVVGVYAPPFREKGELESQEVIQSINACRPDILWIGLGAPKQDYWMHLHRPQLEVSVMIGVGAAFDFIAGTKPQAPLWMRQNGMEWLFRFCCEPKRLWRRYLVTNTKFFYYLITNQLSRSS